MASMREIKRRKTSIQSTAQITKAMKLVSTVKFQKAKVKAETTRPYFDKMYETVSSILSRSGNIHHRYLMQGESQKKAVIVITSNRGLAGGYNSNVEKAVTSVGFNPADVQLYTNLSSYLFSCSIEKNEYAGGSCPGRRAGSTSHLSG